MQPVYKNKPDNRGLDPAAHQRNHPRAIARMMVGRLKGGHDDRVNVSLIVLVLPGRDLREAGSYGTSDIATYSQYMAPMLQFSTSAWAPLAAMAAMGSSTGFIAASLWRRHGVKAVVLSSGDDAHAYLANVFKLAILAGTAFCVAYALDPLVTAGLGPISWLAGPGAAAVGVALMVLGASLVAAAQLNMGLSWRVGIDHLHRTALVTEGLYRISRNLIYLGMFAVITGIFLMAPNAVTLTMMGVSLVAVPAQVRLEEQFLGHLHGADFAAYRMRTRRWL